MSDDDDADARTLVGAENPYFAPPPAPPPVMGGNSGSMSRPRVDAATRPMMPTQPPPPAPQASAPRQRVVPPGRPFDAVAAAMAEDGDLDRGPATGPHQPSASLPTMSQPPQPFGMASAPPAFAPQDPYPQHTPAEPWPAPRFAQQGFVPSSPQLDLSATTPETPPEALVPAVAPMPWGPLIAAVSVSGVLFIGALAFFVMRMMGAGAATPAELVLTAVGTPPADVVVLLDNAEVGRALPLTTALSEGAHVVEVKGSGVNVRRDVVGTGGTVRQPVLFAGTADVGGVPTAPAGSWRLLLAAVGDDGRPVDGAEVFVNGRPLGLTPLEAELDDVGDDVTVKIKKDGYTTHELGMKRAGRTVIGPATVALVRGAAGTPTATEPTPTEPTPTTPPEPSPTEPTKTEPEPVKVAVNPNPVEPTPTKPEPTKPEASKPEPAKPTPTKPEPTKPTPTTQTRPEPAKPEPTKTEKPEPAKSTAKVADIQLGTSPYAETTIDGRKYGMTPFFGPRTLTLSVGTHKIEFFDKVNNKKYK
ncbi:MAG TPA: hypothetical protein VGF99_13625, partial [Myxococcota bacterium]